MKKISFYFSVLLLLLSSLIVSGQNRELKSSFFGTMKARHIGPAVMSGRITSIDASNTNPLLVYVGSASGGVWKSTNGGTTFKDVFKDQVQIIGAVALDQNDNDLVWIGTGEPWTRNSISIGNGIYKSTNGGEKWQNVGLINSNHIAEIIINPENSNEVYVAALGNVWAPNDERGVFKTTDGGLSWSKILFVSETTGCSDLAVDPDNPQLIYAAMWDFLRKPYTFRSGGKGSGLYLYK